MTDISDIVPDFDIKPYRHLTHSLEKNDITVCDLLTSEPIDIARRCPLPLNDLKTLINAIVTALHDGIIWTKPTDLVQKTASQSLNQDNADDIDDQPLRVKTLDETIDSCLGGGIRTGYVTEIVGESAVGKTQFALTFLLSAQLPPPIGLGKSVIYLSTEAPLNTGRLYQMLAEHPYYQSLADQERPSLDKVHTIATNNLEIQNQIIQRQLPLAVERLNVGLIVIDSIAANFRAEHETRTAQGLADRAADLTKTGASLRDIARKHNLAIVVMNQVSDRFTHGNQSDQERNIMSSPQMTSSPAPQTTNEPVNITSSSARRSSISLNSQQRFFSGWEGDNSNHSSTTEQLKNPALGLAWTNQIAARIVLKMESERVYIIPATTNHEYQGGNIWKDKKKRRFISVVFSPWVESGLKPIQYEIQAQGPVSVSIAKNAKDEKDTDQMELIGEHSELLNPGLWSDDDQRNDEFP